MLLKDTNIVITGGARGIGRYLCDSFLKEAKSVTILDNNKELLKGLEQHENLSLLTCDVTSIESVKNAVNVIFENIEGNIALINNAGIIHSEPLFNLMSREDKKHKIENWNRVIDINLNGVFNITSHIVEKMIIGKHRGVIINISSISAKGNVGQSAYSATKAAVEALTKTWSKELGMFKIRCSCIAPGFFDTPSTRESLNEHMLKKWEKSVPIGRLGNLSELYLAAKFIVENDYYNGKILEIDGGLTI